MHENSKLNRKLIIEKPLPKQKKKGSILPLLIFIFLLCGTVAFIILEKLNYINYLDFI